MRLTKGEQCIQFIFNLSMFYRYVIIKKKTQCFHLISFHLRQHGLTSYPGLLFKTITLERGQGTRTKEKKLF